MNLRVNQSEGVAVDPSYYYRPMSTCPRGCKVLPLTRNEIAVIGSWNGKDDQFIGWSPLPKIRKERRPAPPGFDDGLGF